MFKFYDYLLAAMLCDTKNPLLAVSFIRKNQSKRTKNYNDYRLNIPFLLEQINSVLVLEYFDLTGAARSLLN